MSNTIYSLERKLPLPSHLFFMSEVPLNSLISYQAVVKNHPLNSDFDGSRLLCRHCCRHSVQILVIGKGSNCLFDDRGFNGCIILNRIDFIERVGPGAYRVGSGYPFNRLGMQCSKEGFSGLEFAGGIPGTVGGAAFMNAGANGQESADTIENVSIITMDGSHRVLNRSELAFGYRRSCFQQMEDMAAIVAVAFKLTPSVSAMEWQRTYLER